MKMLVLGCILSMTLFLRPASAQEQEAPVCPDESMSEVCLEQEQPLEDEVVETPEEVLEEPDEENNAETKGEPNPETVAGNEPVVTDGAVLGASTESPQVLAAATPSLVETGSNRVLPFVGIILIAAVAALHYKSDQN